MRVAAKDPTIYTASTFEMAEVGLRTHRAGQVDRNAVRSMQPLRRWRSSRPRAGRKAFAGTRKRPRTELAALIHGVPAAHDPTNGGLRVVDVIRNEIIHRDHLRMPRDPLGRLYMEMAGRIVIDRVTLFWIRCEKCRPFLHGRRCSRHESAHAARRVLAIISGKVYLAAPAASVEDGHDPNGLLT